MSEREIGIAIGLGLGLALSAIGSYLGGVLRAWRDDRRRRLRP